MVTDRDFDQMRYVIEAKDEHGWFDYDKKATEAEAVELANSLMASFNNNVRVVDLENMASYEGLTEVWREEDFH